jgi:hypothetical protein
MTNALAVVAHHDDHLLWMGVTIERTKRWGWNWTVLALGVRDPAKAAYFDDCCKEQGVTFRRLALVGDDQGAPLFRDCPQERLETAICETLEGVSFDWVFTHSREPGGEYGGHSAHMEVQRSVTSLVQRNRLGKGVKRLAYFSYGYVGGATAAMARIDKDSAAKTHYCQLTYQELCWKAGWCLRIPDSLEGIGCPCPNPEAFEGDGLELPKSIDKDLALS